MYIFVYYLPGYNCNMLDIGYNCQLFKRSGLSLLSGRFSKLFCGLLVYFSTWTVECPFTCSLPAIYRLNQLFPPPLCARTGKIYFMYISGGFPLISDKMPGTRSCRGQISPSKRLKKMENTTLYLELESDSWIVQQNQLAGKEPKPGGFLWIIA